VKPATVQARLDAAGGLPALEEAVGIPAAQWGGNCHSISLKIIKSGLLGPGRVARDSARAVTGQHSWIILGDAEHPDPYSEESVIADPTIFHYEGRDPYVLVKQNLMHTHWPQGTGDIWTSGGPPPGPTGKLIELEGYADLSDLARSFLELCGYPLDYWGWAYLVHGPVQGWPAGEIITAMCATKELAVVTPIDIVGMTTELNPKGLYW
jgi:hypothetical protein